MGEQISNYYGLPILDIGESFYLNFECNIDDLIKQIRQQKQTKELSYFIDYYNYRFRQYSFQAQLIDTRYSYRELAFDTGIIAIDFLVNYFTNNRKTNLDYPKELEYFNIPNKISKFCKNYFDDEDQYLIDFYNYMALNPALYSKLNQIASKLFISNKDLLDPFFDGVMVYIENKIEFNVHNQFNDIISRI